MDSMSVIVCALVCMRISFVTTRRNERKIKLSIVCTEFEERRARNKNKQINPSKRLNDEKIKSNPRQSCENTLNFCCIEQLILTNNLDDINKILDAFKVKRWKFGMSISLESLSKEIGSSINKPLPCNENQEKIAQITQQNSSEMTTESVDNESIMGEGSFISGDSNNQKYDVSEMKTISCSRFYACKYCCQIDLFIMFWYTIIAVLDSCFRLGLSLFVAIKSTLYKMLQFYLLAYRDQSNTIQRIIKGFCACLVAILYIEVYLIIGLLEFFLKPIPHWIAYQIHDLLFKFHSHLSKTNHDLDDLNLNENTT